MINKQFYNSICDFLCDLGCDAIMSDVVGNLSDINDEKPERLNSLKQRLYNFNNELKNDSKNLVFSDGNYNAKLMLIGEAPGAEEDKTGIPFVGASGKLLDKILSAVSLDRNSVYITNVVPWRPENNRTPTDSEIKLFMPFLEEHVDIIQPKIIVTLGMVATKAIIGKYKTLESLRMAWHKYRDIQVRVTYHPSFLLRSPSHKTQAWHDWLSIKGALDE